MRIGSECVTDAFAAGISPEGESERLRLLIGPRNRRGGGAGPALAGHLELAHLQRADLDLLGAQFPDHRVSDRKPADGDRADRGDGESERTHRRRPEDAGADSHRAGDAHRRGGGAASLVTDADDAGHGCLLWLARRAWQATVAPSRTRSNPPVDDFWLPLADVLVIGIGIGIGWTVRAMMLVAPQRRGHRAPGATPPTSPPEPRPSGTRHDRHPVPPG